MLEKIKTGELEIAIIGLGYVGLPLAVEFGKNLIPSVLMLKNRVWRRSAVLKMGYSKQWMKDCKTGSIYYGLQSA